MNKYMNTLLQITEKQLQDIDFNKVELRIPFHEYTQEGDYHRLVADDLDLFYNDEVMVRCFGFYASMTEGDKKPDVSIERIELYMGEEEMEITPQQAYHIEQKVIESINPILN